MADAEAEVRTPMARFARAVLRVARVLPPGLALRLGGVIGAAFGALPMRDQRRAREHLARAFPDRPRTWIRRMARSSFRHAGRMALWTLATLHRDPRALRREVVVEGRANLAATRAASLRGTGVVICSGHFGNWELLARVTGTILPVTLLGRRLRDPGLDQLIRGMRGHGGNRLLYQDSPAMAALRELRQGRGLATLPDQDVPRLAGVFVPWFGTPAYTPIGPATLAVMARVPVQPVLLWLRAGRWTVHWGPRVRAPAGLERDDAALWLTAWCTAYEEAIVRRHPAQWVWWHKRWRTRPPGPGPTTRA